MPELELTVIAIHGEGDRATVNALQAHRNRISGIDTIPNEDPDILVVLRDATHDFRIEWPVQTWEEVEEWKKLAGWDKEKRHWKHGAMVKVKLGKS